SSSPRATSTDSSLTASATRRRFSTRFSPDPSGTAARTTTTPTTPVITGPAARLVLRRLAIPIASATARPGIHRTPPKDAARPRWKAQVGLDFFIALPSIDHRGRRARQPSLAPRVDCPSSRQYRVRTVRRAGFQIWPHAWQRQYTSTAAGDLLVVLTCSERQNGHGCGFGVITSVIAMRFLRPVPCYRSHRSRRDASASSRNIGELG